MNEAPARFELRVWRENQWLVHDCKTALWAEARSYESAVTVVALLNKQPSRLDEVHWATFAELAQ